MNQEKQNIFNHLRKMYNSEKIASIDKDFLEFEEEMISLEDLESITILLENKKFLEKNTHNSILLYLLDITNDFNINKQRSDTVGGSPPDIDIDLDARERYKGLDWIIDYWGEDNVANIVTHGRLGPKSLARKYFSVTQEPTENLATILKKIPAAVHGKEASFEKVFQAAPELKTQTKFKGFARAAEKLDGLVANFGIHAAGLVISDFDISDVIPIWAKKEKEVMSDGKKREVLRRITQYDMKEVETHGLIKYDFLSIDNLTVIKEIVKLLSLRGIEIDPYQIPDGDKKAYELLRHGMLTGIFQMEVSGTAKTMLNKVAPQSIKEISDVSSLNRPGPMQAGLDELYIQNKNNNYPPDDLPIELQEVLKDTYWTLIYQEQIMKICTDLCGMTEQEGDDVRRALG